MHFNNINKHKYRNLHILLFFTKKIAQVAKIIKIEKYSYNFICQSRFCVEIKTIFPRNKKVKVEHINIFKISKINKK